MTTTTSDLSTDRKSWVPADVPKVVLRPNPVGEWHTRAQVSTLLLPKPARTSFCTRYVSSLVQREEVMPPIESRPYFAWMRFSSLAAYPIASSQETSRHESEILLRIMGFTIRSECVA